MTLDEAGWILERTKTIGQRYWFRGDNWPVDHWVSFQANGYPDSLWMIWRTTGGVPELLADGIQSPSELFLELENVCADWSSGNDCTIPCLTLEAVSATMAAETLDNALLAGDRICEATAIKCGLRAPGSEDAVLSAQISWHRAPVISKLLNWKTAIKLTRAPVSLPTV
jgi:hypothetical protein